MTKINSRARQANANSNWDQADLSHAGWTLRRRVAAILRLAVETLMKGKKRKVGALGRGAAVAAALAMFGFATPALAQLALGCGDAVNSFDLAISVCGAPAAVANGGGAGTNAIAIGNDAQAVVTGGLGAPIAIGGDANATSPSGTHLNGGGGDNAIAIGNETVASDTDNIALGYGASATGSFATALGQVANASGGEAVAVGPMSSAAALDAIAIGYNSGANGFNSVAIGGNQAANNGAQTSGSGDVAIGDAKTAGAGIGNGTAPTAVAIGWAASALAGGASAVGSLATANVANGLALGADATANNANDVALGAGSSTAAAVATSSVTIRGTTYTFAGTEPSSTVSVGSSDAPRTITYVAAGRLASTSTDAINGSELYATNQALTAIGDGGAGPVQYANAATPTTPNGGVATQFETLVGATPGSTVTLSNLTGGLLTSTSTQAVNGAQVNTFGTSVASIIGGAATFNSATGTIMGESFTIGGVPYTNITSAFNAINNDLNGGGIKYFHANSTLADSTATGVNSVAIGPAANAIGANSIAEGDGATANNAGDVALGSNSTTAAAVQTSSATIGTLALTGFAGTTPTSTVSIGAPGAERTLTNVAAGRVTSTSTDAVNGSELYAVASDANNLGVSVASIFGGGATFSANGTINDPSYIINGDTYNNVGAALEAINNDLNGGGIKYFHANSTLADSTATGTNSVAIGPVANSVGANSVAIGNGATANNAGDVALGSNSTTAAVVKTTSLTIAGTTYALAGTAPTSTVSVGAVGSERTMTNVAAGQVTSTSTDAVNGSELYAADEAINALSGTVSTLPKTAPLQYSNSATPTTPNGGVVTNDTTLVGATSGPVVIHNLAPGVAGTDAVNVNQLNALGANTVQYSTTTSNTIVLNSPNNNNNPGAPVTINNVAPGAVNATSTQAVNGSQLYATNQAISNLSALTDTVQKEAYAGTAVALASAGLRYDDRPGKLSTAAAVGYYHQQVGFAGGLGMTSENGVWRINASVSVTPGNGIKPDVGFNAGASYTFN